jgi:hypothetical protein
MRVEYSSNNSGGRWWLKDKDWEKLRKAGWVIHDFAYEKAEWEAKPAAEKAERSWDPLRWWDEKDGERRYMGALAKEAHLECETPADAIRSFEKATGLKASDEGCNCCGPPHNFRWGRAIDDTLPKTAEYGSVSGEGCLQYLFPDVEPMDLREAYEKSAAKRKRR